MHEHAAQAETVCCQVSIGVRVASPADQMRAVNRTMPSMSAAPTAKLIDDPIVPRSVV